ncbi:MAG: 4-hydroxy-tetrahydrodipicolinate reductase [Gemmataceae bacterium]|nr:4-hydroxy-tetrahydrodipicolinate reductase [Gemmataceae bacterium]
MKTSIAVNGACGRMGKRILQLAHEDKSLRIVAALDSGSHPDFGRDAGELAGFGKLGVNVTTSLPAHPAVDAVIDFSMPEGTMVALKACVERRVPIVVATTGFTVEQRQEIEAAAHHTAVLLAPNMSLVVNVLFKLVRDAAKLLKDQGFDAEIIERHHRFKKDAPSGTASHFAKVIQEVWGEDFAIQHGREGLIGERPAKEIGMHAIRAGDNVGEHTIVFSTLGETMELVHKGHTRDAYVHGALAAAKFLAGKPAGRYSMEDVLGL